MHKGDFHEFFFWGVLFICLFLWQKVTSDQRLKQYFNIMEVHLLTFLLRVRRDDLWPAAIYLILHHYSKFIVLILVFCLD